MGVVDWHRSLWQRSCVVILLLLLALVASGKREVELEASVPPHPDKEPVTLTALPHHIEGVAELQFNWFFYDEENAPDQRSVKLCSDNDCQDTQTHYYPSGNFSYRVEVKRHNVSGEWDAWAVGRSNIFVAGRIENLLLKVSKATATTNRSVHISTTAYPKEDLTGVVHYNYSFGDGAKHVAGHHASVAHVYRAPGNYTLAVQGRNAVNVVETRALITVQDAVSGGRATAPTLNGTRGVQVNLNITGVSGSDIHYKWDFDNGDVVFTNTSAVGYVYNSTGLFNITVSASNLVSSKTFNVTAQISPDVGPKRAAEIATPLAVALVSVVICIGGIWYHRWYFGRRGVEVARFDFVPTPQKPKSLLSRIGRSGQGSRGYGAVETDMFEL